MLRSIAPVRSPYSFLWSLLISVIMLGSLGTTVPTAVAQDLVGIYWDAGYTTSTANTPTVPGVITGYVVLSDPTGTGGVLGWEACIDVDGPGSLTGWDFQGQAINVGSAPCLVVGYTAPLPAADDILLATFSAIATDVGPIEVTMKPLWSGSIPNQLSYISGDAPEDLIVMSTAGGSEVVAGLNGAIPGLIFSATELDFGAPALGNTVSRFLTISNNSSSSVTIAPAVQEFCDFFGLPAGTDPVTVYRSSSRTIEVTFSPIRVQRVNCTLSLGPTMPLISLTGAGTEPVTSWSFGGSGFFDEVLIGQTATRTIYLLNTGDTTINLDTAFRESCPEFVLISGGGTTSLTPGNTASFTVHFNPTTPGYHSCHLSFGHPDIPDFLFYGTGTTPATSWTAPTNYDFLTQFVSLGATASLTITNTGSTIIPIFASLPVSCDAYTIESGGGATVNLQPGATHVITVQFLAPATGHFRCFMDLGSVIPDIQLDGDAIAPSSAISATPTQLIFPATLVTQSLEMDVIIANNVTYDVPLTVELAQPDSVFSVISGGGAQILAAGAHQTVTVRFLPTGAADFRADLSLGGALDLIPLLGTGFVGLPTCRIEPASLSFDDVPLGSSQILSITITNDGDAGILLEPQTTDPNFFIDAPPYMLEPEQHHTLDVRFQPTTAGPHSGSLLLGDVVCSAVSLLGNAFIDPSLFNVTPDSVVFTPTAVNLVADREILFTNLSFDAIDLNVQIQSPTAGFNLLQGAGASTVQPGESLPISVRFRPLAAQVYETNLLLGAGLPSLPISGEGVIVVPDCLLSEMNLNYGAVPIGTATTRFVGVTNAMDTALFLTPVSSATAYLVLVDSLTVAPGATGTFGIQFQPTDVTTYQAVIDLGPAVCADVNCFGEGLAAQGNGEDLLGIYFDTWYQQNSVFAQSVGQVIEGYLVLSNPSNSGGVSGWECRVDLDGPALITSWSLAGQALNLTNPPEFIVGLAAPLPYTDNALLATFSALLTSLDQDSELSVRPVSTPSLPDQMAWVPGDLPGVLLPMRSVLGQPAVAFIATSVLAVAAPTPRAQLLGQQVDLSWPTPTVPNEGCHVYRRFGAEAPVRLTSTPLSTTGPQMLFTDATGSLPPGTTVYYSYAIIQDGNELARSAEARVELPGATVTATRLLPNVPNPFNPMTEIRFELDAPQTVSLRIYDVTGRLVRDLVQGSLPNGSHTRVWQGRDDRGRQVPSGAYYVRLVTEGKIDRRKIMLLK